ncbi:hypothetical protein [Streptomyces globisporus]|nr:hypothetical protein [Streptomyces globisporus]
MLRFRSARWAAVLLTSLALLVPVFDGAGDSADTVVTAAATDDLIWG